MVSCFMSKMRGFTGLELGGGHPVAAKEGENEEKRFGGFLDILNDFETHNYMKFLLCVSHQLRLEQLAKSLVFLECCPFCLYFSVFTTSLLVTDPVILFIIHAFVLAFICSTSQFCIN